MKCKLYAVIILMAKCFSANSFMICNIQEKHPSFTLQNAGHLGYVIWYLFVAKLFLPIGIQLITS